MLAKGGGGVPSNQGDFRVQLGELLQLPGQLLLLQLDVAAPPPPPLLVVAVPVCQVSKPVLHPISPEEILPEDGRDERTEDKEQKREEETAGHPGEDASKSCRPEGVDEPPGRSDDRLANQNGPTSGSCN